MSTLSNLVEVLVYAAAMDLYKRTNASVRADRGYVPTHGTVMTHRTYLSDRQTSAMLDTVAWNARPAWLEK